MDFDRQDDLLCRVLGRNMMTATGRLFGLMALIAIVGGGSFWLLSR
jgi:hypothetical protein